MDRRHFITYSLLPATAAGASVQRAAAVRITVLKRSVQKEFQKHAYGAVPACNVLKDGQSFLVNSVTSRAPEGMCQPAWDAIAKAVSSIQEVGPEKTVVCCTDGFRPVFFLLERVA